jgi:hypothetical protein
MIPEADELSEWDRDQKHSQYSHYKTMPPQNKPLVAPDRSDSDSEGHKVMSQTIKTDRENKHSPMSKFVFNEGDPNVKQ